MKGKATIYNVDRTIFVVELSAPPTLDFLQSTVGGYIEAVPLFEATPQGNPCVAFCNEEGKLNGMPLNVEATTEWYRLVPKARGIDHLVGPIVVIEGDEELMRSL